MNGRAHLWPRAATVLKLDSAPVLHWRSAVIWLDMMRHADSVHGADSGRLHTQEQQQLIGH